MLGHGAIGAAPLASTQQAIISIHAVVFDYTSTSVFLATQHLFRGCIFEATTSAVFDGCVPTRKAYEFLVQPAFVLGVDGYIVFMCIGDRLLPAAEQLRTLSAVETTKHFTMTEV